jgi:hypothetical protein
MMFVFGRKLSPNTRWRVLISWFEVFSDVISKTDEHFDTENKLGDNSFVCSRTRTPDLCVIYLEIQKRSLWGIAFRSQLNSTVDRHAER